MAGNDSQGLRYGAIETQEKYYLEWKEDAGNDYKHKLDLHLSRICNKSDFCKSSTTLWCSTPGLKKLCRHNQFFGIEAAKRHIASPGRRHHLAYPGFGQKLDNGLACEMDSRECQDSRVLIVTDRTELDDQIEKVFNGVEEDIYRTTAAPISSPR